jgi:hypothetical protein
MLNELTTELMDFVRGYPIESVPDEVTFNRDLCRRFAARGETYPDGTFPGRADAVVRRAGLTVWIEVKIAQTYFSHADSRRDNASLFDKHMYRRTPSEHTVVNDILQKLNSLIGHPDATHVGELLILLWTDMYPLPAGAIERLRKTTGIGRLPWAEHHLGPWADPLLTDPRGSIDAYYWQRPAHTE